ncbi:MAG: DUF58 domain-containing protein [Inhella sp.]
MRLKQGWQAWWKTRHPASDEQLLTQRNLYIVPTRVGLFFLLTQAVLLVASINDQLSLGYALTFLLAGCGLASMHTTHGNLRGLLLTLQPPEAGHADQDLPLRIRLHNPGRARFGVGLRLADATAGTLAYTDLPAQGSADLVIAWRAPRRGLHEPPVLRIETRFPLGLFVAWSYWRPASRQWVYPAIETHAPPAPAGRQRQGETEAGQRARAGGDEFLGVRTWRDGDGLRSVVWKKAAQASSPDAPLWVRDMGSPPASSERWLDAAQTQGLPEELRWQRLAAWVLQVDAEGHDWGLRLGHDELPLGQGPAQRQLALQKLALA